MAYEDEDEALDASAASGKARVVNNKVTFEMSEEDKNIEKNLIIQTMHMGKQPFHPGNFEMFDPDAGKTIPKKGAYVMILRPLPIAPPFDKITPGMVFWAKHPQGTDSRGFDAKGYYKVELFTPWGTPHVWPYEYSPIQGSRLVALYDAGELLFHPQHIELASLEMRLYYLMSRGISKEQALLLMLGKLNKNIGWWEPRQDLKDRIAQWRD